MYYKTRNLTTKTCALCGYSSKVISEKLGVCKECILTRPKEALNVVQKVRKKYREKYGLPQVQPQEENGVRCTDCVNNCRIALNQFGYCKLVRNIEGKKTRLAGDNKKGGLFSFYFDPLPTNCVAEPFCAGCSKTGYPEYSYTTGAEIGYNSLAVFYQACTFDCLYCQNYQYRQEVNTSKARSAEELVNAIRAKTSCICFFGGDPAAQIRHSNAVGELVLEKSNKESRILRVCWETNGSANPKLMQKSTQIALESGGTIKIDFKAFDNNLNKSLSGTSNKYTMNNIKQIGKRFEERAQVPLLIVNILLVPGYIDVLQVQHIAEFIVDINPQIPLSLAAFYPTFVMDDLPTTSKQMAEKCYKTAVAAGVEKVSIGNKHLLR